MGPAVDIAIRYGNRPTRRQGEQLEIAGDGSTTLGIRAEHRPIAIRAGFVKTRQWLQKLFPQQITELAITPREASHGIRESFLKFLKEFSGPLGLALPLHGQRDAGLDRGRVVDWPRIIIRRFREQSRPIVFRQCELAALEGEFAEQFQCRFRLAADKKSLDQFLKGPRIAVACGHRRAASARPRRCGRG